MRRKGELSRSQLNASFPHQVALEQLVASGEQYQRSIEIEAFCKAHSAAPRPHTILVDDRWWVVYCFAEASDAAAFQTLFGGRAYDPAAPRRGDGWQGKGDFKRD